MKRLIIFVLIAFTTFSCKEQKSGTNEVHLITPQEMSELILMSEVQVVDVRTPEEYKEGYIGKAKNLNFYDDSFEKDIEKLDASKPVCVYCKKGGRSAKAAKLLKEKGFVKVYDLDGGVTKWKESGLKLN